MNWFIFWIIIYLGVIIFLTLRHIKSGDLENYLVNNRKTTTFPLVFTIMATFVGGGTSFGLMAMGYESGFAAVGIGVAYVIGFFILAYFAPHIRKFGAENNIYSFPQFLNEKYIKDQSSIFSKLFSSTVSGVNIFIFFFLLSAQFVAMASLLKFSFEIGFQTAAIASCIVVIAYTAFAGLSGVIITDMLQFIVILIMIFLIFIPGVLADTANLKSLSQLPKEMLNGTSYGILFLLALPVFFAPSVIVRMDIWQRILASKSEKTAKRVSLISGLGMLPFYFLFPLIGMAVKLSLNNGIDPRNVPYLFLENNTSAGLLGFAVVGLLSALMSSGDSFLNIISISAVRDFLGWKRGKVSKNLIQKRIRIVTFFFGGIALIMAINFPKIVDLMVVGLATIVIFVPVTFLALIKKDVVQYKKVALSSILSGFFVNLTFFIWGILSPEQFQAKSSFIPGFIAALLVLSIGVVFIKKRNHDIDNTLR